MIDREGFKQIAEVMAKVRPTHSDEAMDQWKRTVQHLAARFNRRNRHFDHNLFMSRCRDA